MDSHRNQDCFTEVISYCRTRAKKSGNGEKDINQAKIPFLLEAMICFITSDLANKQKSWKWISHLWLKHTGKLLSPFHIRIVSSKTRLKSLVSMVDANDTLWYTNLTFYVFLKQILQECILCLFTRGMERTMNPFCLWYDFMWGWNLGTFSGTDFHIKLSENSKGSLSTERRHTMDFTVLNWVLVVQYSLFRA